MSDQNINVPNLDGLGLPGELTRAIRQAFQYISSMRAATFIVGLFRNAPSSSLFLRGDASLAAAWPTVQVVTSNTIGTVYQNTDTIPRDVTISLALNAGTSQLQVLCDSSNPPTTQIAIMENTLVGNFLDVPYTFKVLPGYFYKLVSAGVAPTLLHWIEWRQQ